MTSDEAMTRAELVRVEVEAADVMPAVREEDGDDGVGVDGQFLAGDGTDEDAEILHGGGQAHRVPRST